MTSELPTKYNPGEVEDKWYRLWEGKGYFHSEPDPQKKSFTIVIPPPNITGVLHMGHALNSILQDVLIRWRRMQGYNTLWMPGTDHAGIATQNVVERELLQKGLRRQDLGRDKFVETVWKWREEYGSTIIKQLKKIGSSCDWQRERFTMDQGLSRAVREAFVRLWQKGLIYKGKYIINWCPRCQTALADDEVDHETHEGSLWYFRYPFRDEPHLGVTIATTRPETMLGDVAVAVNPGDERYKEFIGEHLLLPIVEREIPIIADEMVDKEFGTGAVKVTPAHDPNDFEMSLRHQLQPVTIMAEDGTMNTQAGEFAGMDRFECREALVEELRQKRLLVKIEPHVHSVGHCYRCHTVIEPYLSDQWFVRMKPLAQAALRATEEGKVTFYPERWTKVYLNWLENVRDWCISRQIWWGHQIPAWYCKDCGEINVSMEDPRACTHCNGKHLTQDPDVLDTWFSSALWPFSTLGWPADTLELKTYYPTNVLVTGRDIIYFWVARMVMMGLEMLGKEPFGKVYIHGTILDEQGRRMSKSLGNGIDPLEMTERYGVDAVRMSLLLLTTEGQDIKLSETKFEMGRNFTNKVWNAARFVIMNLSQSGVDWPSLMGEKVLPLSFEDRWILSRLSNAVTGSTEALEQFRFNEALQTVYDFFWHDLCDWYLEIVKPRLYEPANELDKKTALSTLLHVFQDTLRLLHPFAPFLTEEVWSVLGKRQEESLVIGKWPEARPRDLKTEQTMELLQGVIKAVRNVRRNFNITDRQPLKALISAPDTLQADSLKAHNSFLRQRAFLEELEIGINLVRPANSASAVVGPFQLFIPLTGIINLDTERLRHDKQIQQLEEYLSKVQKKLSNKDFLAKAPPQVAEKEREREKELSEQINKLKLILTELR
ncbi:MAG: valine--tRNA ligase [Planctomycetes bacterium]|nr:valine--tRNA ligase [Planctomycetota bacterium]